MKNLFLLKEYSEQNLGHGTWGQGRGDRAQKFLLQNFHSQVG